MSNRSDLADLHERLAALAEPLTAIGEVVPSRNAAYLIARSREMIGAAERMLADALKAPAAGLADPLDLPPWPPRWGEPIWVEAGSRPGWIDVAEWVGNRDMPDGTPGYATTADRHGWHRAGYVRLRADHPHYVLPDLKSYCVTTIAWERSR